MNPKPTLEEVIIGTALGIGVAAAIAIGSMEPGAPLDPSLPPENTVMVEDRGKYRPESMPGYESVADFPDEYWIKSEDFEKVKDHYQVKPIK